MVRGKWNYIWLSLMYGIVNGHSISQSEWELWMVVFANVNVKGGIIIVTAKMELWVVVFVNVTIKEAY